MDKLTDSEMEIFERYKEHHDPEQVWPSEWKDHFNEGLKEGLLAARELKNETR